MTTGSRRTTHDWPGPFAESWPVVRPSSAVSRPWVSLGRRGRPDACHRPTENFVYTNRPLNPNGEMPLYGKIPKFEMPPFDVFGSPGFRFRSGYTSNTLSAPTVMPRRDRSVYESEKSVSHLAPNV